MVVVSLVMAFFTVFHGFDLKTLLNLAIVTVMATEITKDVEINPEALRAIRLANGMSIENLAVEVGVRPSHLSNVEAGRRGLSPRAIKAAAEALKVPINALLQWKDVA